MCFSVIAGGLMAAGTGYQLFEGRKASKAAQEAERLREEQMRLDAERQRRKQVREMLASRATALSNIQSAAGSGGVDSSAMAGATGQITNQFGNNQNDLAQSVRIGAGIFQANAAMAEAQGQAAIGGAVASIGRDIFKAGPELTRIGETVFGSNDGGGQRRRDTLSGWATQYETNA